MTAREITLDAAAWREFRDIYAALLPAMGAPDWHGPNLDAVYDALVAGHYRVMPAAVPSDDGSGLQGGEGRSGTPAQGRGDVGFRRARPLRVTVINTGAASAAVRAYLARLVTVFDDARAHMASTRRCGWRDDQCSGVPTSTFSTQCGKKAG